MTKKKTQKSETCELCGYTYNNIKAAQKCAKNHRKLGKVPILGSSYFKPLPLTKIDKEFIGVDLARGKSRTVRTVWNKQKVDELMSLITESFPKRANQSELEDYMVDLVDEYFPKGDTSRGKAIVMMSRLFVKATSLETVEKRLKLWVENHGDVFQRGLGHDGIPLTDHWWYVQNCLGDIFGWSNEIGDILEKVELPAPYMLDSCPHIISKKDQKKRK